MSAKEIVVSSTNCPTLNDINLLNADHRELALGFIKSLIESPKSGIKTIADGLALMSRAQQLGIPFATAIDNISIVSGKTVISVHVAKMLLLKAGIKFTKTKDYIPLYNYTDGNIIFLENQLPDYAIKCGTAEQAKKVTDNSNTNVGFYPVRYYYMPVDGKTQLIPETSLPSNVQIIKSVMDAESVKKNSKIPILPAPPQTYDICTEYKFERVYKDGSTKVEISRFTWQDAVTAGLSEKDVWQHYPKQMLDNRAFMYGARAIADDLLMGCMETLESQCISDNPIGYEDNEIIDAETISVD